ncbi:MAG: hypothetical protein ACI81P_003305 [Neolewinella sp.]|jgi:hypothetical protein
MKTSSPELQRFHIAFEQMISTRNLKAVWDYYKIDRTGLTELELISYDQRLFALNWHELQEELASEFQTKAHPATAKFIFEQVTSGNIPAFEHKSFSRKCVWALADIGTEEAKSYLEALSQSEDEHVLVQCNLSSAILGADEFCRLARRLHRSLAVAK